MAYLERLLFGIVFSSTARSFDTSGCFLDNTAVVFDPPWDLWSGRSATVPTGENGKDFHYRTNLGAGLFCDYAGARRNGFLGNRNARL